MQSNFNKIAYKIERRADLLPALESGAYQGSLKDIEDGFIHLSTKEQVAETLSLHFNGVEDLVIAEVNIDLCKNDIKWETSRNGKEFPHLYAALPQSAIIHIFDVIYDGKKPIIPYELQLL